MVARKRLQERENNKNTELAKKVIVCLEVNEVIGILLFGGFIVTMVLCIPLVIVKYVVDYLLP